MNWALLIIQVTTEHAASFAPGVRRRLPRAIRAAGCPRVIAWGPKEAGKARSGVRWGGCAAAQWGACAPDCAVRPSREHPPPFADGLDRAHRAPVACAYPEQQSERRAAAAAALAMRGGPWE